MIFDLLANHDITWCICVCMYLGTVQLKGNVALARNLRVRVESTYLSAILTEEIHNRY